MKRHHNNRVTKEWIPIEATFSQEIWNWLRFYQSNSRYYRNNKYSDHRYQHLYFENEEDALIFKLKFPILG